MQTPAITTHPIHLPGVDEAALEICCYSVESVAEAAKGGASRVELCDNVQEGGTTPSSGTIELAKAIPGIQVYVIIRPRGGDFCYSATEFEVMKYDIKRAKELGVDGVVLGILLPDGHVDKDRMKELLDLAAPLDITFHRAFDMTVDPFAALDEIADLGIKRILSSGTFNTAIEGLDLLQKLVKHSSGRVTIMAGSGVNESNIEALYKIGIREFHSSAMTFVSTEMNFQNPKIKMGKEGQGSEFEKTIVDIDKVRGMRRKIDELLQSE
ncbi:copper homeostasis protein CutC [Solitalea koreensis]|uniref:PF03932 family protein CutC n=1 Tax=Solitalea koreensis TaxID=543615 RepID=A0A521BYZ6_9SPHI|nr:copper homeostasis protein CutC [Solitalea koreensis]SMO52386.1 copper homeostasis protein [Solitalea koreensis]